MDWTSEGADEECGVGSSGTVPISTVLAGLDCMIFRCRNDAAMSMDIVSDGCLRLTGYPAEALRAGGSTSFRSLISAADVDRARNAHTTDTSHATRYNVDYHLRRADGQLRWIKERGRLIRDGQGAVIGFEGFAEDITERRQLRDTTQREAHVDALTGLANRRLVNDRISQSLMRAEASKGSIAVVFVDLDHFKIINDSFGHEHGDRLLQAMAQRLKASVRQGDTVARQGGDEFVLLLNSFESREELLTIAQRVHDAIAVPWRQGRREFHVTSSIGIAVYPSDGRSVDQLLRNADAAMYKAKGAGRNQVQFFTPELNRAMVTRIGIEHRLRNALARKQLVLHYQPRVDMATGAVVAAEALLRWQLPRQGLVMPARFIAIAEETGLIVPIGKWVLHSACEQAMAWMVSGLPPMVVSVNVSPRQFRGGEIVETIASALHDTGLPPRLLQIELTENMAMQGAEQHVSMLTQIKALGVQLAIDDFGTGYSNLSYLKRFPVDQLKVDRSFVAGLPDDEDDTAIVRAIITLGHQLGLRVVAEGVETESQQEFLRENNCDELQGYLLGRPVPADEFTRFMDSRELSGATQQLRILSSMPIAG